MSRIFLTLAVALAIAGCASTRPVLYPNEHLNTVGAEAADIDIEYCTKLAESAGADSEEGGAGDAAAKTLGGGAIGAAAGAVGGAIVGAAGSGAAIGAASGATSGLLYWLFGKEKRSPAFENFVNQCLQERGYDVMGWD